MSRFASDFSAVGFPQLQWALGEPCTYLVAGATSATAVTAAVRVEADEVLDQADGLVLRRRIAVRLSTAEVASPARGDVLTWSSLPWGFDRLTSAGGGYVVCEFVRTEPYDKTRQGRAIRR